MMSLDKLRVEYELLCKSRKVLSASSKMYLASIANNLGKHYFDIKDFIRARRYYKTELSICVDLSESRSQANAHNRLGLCEGEIGNYGTALKHLDRFFRIALVLDDAVLKHQAVLNKGYVWLWKATRGDKNEFFVKESLKKAKKCCAEALELFGKIKVGMVHSFDDGKEFRSVRRGDLADIEITALYAAGCVCLENGEAEEAFGAFKRGLKLRRYSENGKKFSHLLSATGLALKEMNSNEKAEIFLRKDLALNSQNDFENDRGLSHFNLFALFTQKRDFGKANASAREYLRIAKEHRGDAFNLEKAKQCFDAAENNLRLSTHVIPNLETKLATMKKTSDKTEINKIIDLLVDLSKNCHEIGDFEKALEYVKDALRHSLLLEKGESSLSLKIKVLSEKGSCEMALKNFENSIQSYGKAIKLREKLLSVSEACVDDMALEMSYDYINLAQSAYEAHSPPSDIIASFVAAESYALKHPEPSERLDALSSALNGRAEVLFEIGNEAEAESLLKKLSKSFENEGKEGIGKNANFKKRKLEERDKKGENGMEKAEILEIGKIEKMRKMGEAEVVEQVVIASDGEERENSFDSCSEDGRFKPENGGKCEKNGENSGKWGKNGENSEKMVENGGKCEKSGENSEKTVKTGENVNFNTETVIDKLNGLLGVTEFIPFKLSESVIESDIFGQKGDAISVAENKPNCVPVSVVWLYLNEDSRWENFDVAASQEIEGYHQNGNVFVFKPTKGFFRGKEDYIIDLMPKPGRQPLFAQTNLKTGRKRKIQRMVLSERSLSENCKEPFLKWIFENWSGCDQNCELVLLTNDCDEYKKVEKLLTETLSAAKITAVHRIQNKQLARDYLSKRLRFLNQNTKKLFPHFLNEHLLFHGADLESIEGVINQGFDIRLNGKHATRYGKGTYFSTNAAYADKFAKPSPAGRKRVLLARVLPGQYAAGNKDYARPPPVDPTVPAGDLYDSTVDDVRLPNVFVVFSSDQAYPQYAVEYQLAVAKI